MGIDWNNRNYGQDPLDEEDIKRAEYARALATHRLCDCGLDSCYPCRSELSFCTICKGGEGDLTYECPGQPITEAQGADVMARRRDFIAGEWRDLKVSH